MRPGKLNIFYYVRYDVVEFWTLFRRSRALVSAAPYSALWSGTCCLELVRVLNRSNPSSTILDKYLPLRLQLRLMQAEIIYSAETQDARPWGPNTIHECAASGAKVIGHRLARSDCLRLAVGSQVVAATNMDEMCVEDGEVGGEHGCRDLAAVGAMTSEFTEQTRSFRRER